MMNGCRPALVPLSEVTIKELRVEISDMKITLEATVDDTVAVAASARFQPSTDQWTMVVKRSCCQREMTLEAFDLRPYLTSEEVLDYLRMFVANFARRRH
jgi:hypothetical protein